MKLRFIDLRRGSVLRCLLFCSCTAVAVPLLDWSLNPHVAAMRLLIQYLFSLLYSNCIGLLLFAVVPRVWMKSEGLAPAGRWLARGGTVALGTTVGCLIANTLLMGMIRGDYDFWGEFIGSIKISLILSSVAVAFVSSFESYQYRLQATAMELKTKELERERALSTVTQMRLASLQARVHPHFLFNTLNSISSLIHDDPERAEDMVTRMAALLRFSLETAQPGLVPLERELSIVRDYLEIEKARFGERLRYEIPALVGEWQEGVWVPPLSIQTLVENSVKYAVNARREGALIRVLLESADGQCAVEVQDDGPGFGSLTLLPGHGLDNLEQRLSMLFGESGQLRIRTTGNDTSVGFKVPVGARVGTATRVSG